MSSMLTDTGVSSSAGLFLFSYWKFFVSLRTHSCGMLYRWYNE